MTIELNIETVKYLERLTKRGGHQGEQARNVLKAAGLYKGGDDQPRDSNGQFASGGGGGGSDKTDGGSRGDLSGKYTPADYGADSKYSGEVKMAQEAMKNGITPEEFKTQNAKEQLGRATDAIHTKPFLDAGERRESVSGHRAAAGALRDAAKLTSNADKKAAMERAAGLHIQAASAHGKVFTVQDSNGDSTKAERSAFKASDKALEATKGLL